MITMCPSADAEKPTVPPKDTALPGSRAAGQRLSGDALLVQQIRQGDSEAGYRFVRDNYWSIYQYLLYLTGSPDVAEDLTQETFLQAWRRVDTFDHRRPLRPWLHRIAHREFLQALRCQRPVVSLEEAGELSEPRAAELMDAIELRVVLSKLPVEEREMLVLHYLAGYQYTEIAQIVGAPVGRVRHRLSEARERLQRELGEGDLNYLNQTPEAVLRRWAWLPLETLTALEARLAWVGEGWLAGARSVQAPEYRKPADTTAAGEGSSSGGTAERPSKGKLQMSDETRAVLSRRQLLEVAGTAAVAAVGIQGHAGRQGHRPRGSL
jgi:RNA polymerase sigma-70 factor (ECF subfamily)